MTDISFTKESKIFNSPEELVYSDVLLYSL